MSVDERFPYSRTASLPVRLTFARERRLDGDAYLSGGFQHRYQLLSLARVSTVKDLAKVWQPFRLKGIRVHPSVGVPFLAATQVFDIRPVVRKWLSAAQTPDLESRFLRPGTILVTCSGNIGETLIAYRPHEGMIVSHDLLRVEPRDARRIGYLYTFFRTRHGRAVMQSSQYGNIIKHMEVGHLETVPVPLFDENLESELAEDIDAVFSWRAKAYELEVNAEEDYAGTLGLMVTASLDGAFDVPAVELFSGRRRLDGYHHNPVARAIAQAIGQVPSLRNVADEIILPQRFARGPLLDDGIPFVGSEEIFKINPSITKFLSPSVFEDDVSDYRVEPGWVLLARSGQIYGTNGNVTLADEWHAGTIISEDVIRIVPSKTIRPGYLKTVLAHPRLGQPLVLRYAFGTSIPHIDPDDIAGMPVPRLASQVEDQIAEKVEVASTLRQKARKREDSAVAKLEKRIDESLAVGGGERGRLKVDLPFDEAIKRALQVAPPEGGWQDERPAKRKARKRD